MTVAAIIQARTGSSRLPGKVLMDIAGKSVLERTVRRVQAARLLDLVAVATTTQRVDDAVAQEAGRLGLACTRGSEWDVLARYREAARQLGVDVIVRLTADCPLIDPSVVDLVVASFQAADPEPDYASNVIVRTYPRGLDVEIFSRASLEHIDPLAVEPHEREHVTPFFYLHPEQLRLVSVVNAVDYSALRWTLDTPADLEFVRAVYGFLEGHGPFSWQTVLRLLEREPSLAAVNSHVEQRAASHSGL
jgi:spore coat polysaccharide biosynthesis protein SpsF